MTSVETAVDIRCSFCGKAHTEVNKMVAGPGVYICDECVGLCNTVIEQGATTPKPRLPIWESLTEQQMLDHIPRVAAVEAQIGQNLREWVGELRNRGVTWERIGSAMGITRQSAWERFSGER